MKQEKPLTTRELQLLELEILKAFDVFAKKHSISYHLAYGTLLGAVRHKGFIPWDDDIDLLIPRPEYERLLDLLESEGLGDAYSFASHRTRSNNYPHAYAKIFLNNTVVFEPKLDKAFQQTPIWIDIFPLDGLPDTRRKQQATFFWALALKNLVYAAIVSPKKVGGVQRLAVLVLKPFTRLIGIKRWVSWTHKLATRYSYEHASTIATLTATSGPQEAIAKDLISDTIDLEFEGELFPAPKNYDSYLSQLYGSYMDLPTEDQRKTHLGDQAYLTEEFHE